ncbi:MAG: acyl-CoA dehydrogenase family protein [Candidatus Dormibacteria bacterium]
MQTFLPYPHLEHSARVLSEEMRQAAAAHDRSGEFPHGLVSRLREEGFLGLTAPVGSGGAGLGLQQSCVILELLGAGDAGTALGLGMHLMVIGSASRSREAWPEPVLSALAAGAARGEVVVNNCASEEGMGSPARGGLPATTLRRCGEGWVLDGEKTWATWLPALTHAVVSCRLDRPGGAPQLAFVLVDLLTSGVERRPAPDAVGLRSAGNGTLVLGEVRIPSDAVLFTRGLNEEDPRAPLMSYWFQLCSSAVYLGCGQAALEAVTAFARSRRPNGREEPISQISGVQQRLGSIDAGLRTGRLLVRAVAGAVDRAESEGDHRGLAELAFDAGVAKVQATTLAAQACEEAMRLAGGPAMVGGGLPLERLWRDVRGGLIHPPQEELLHLALGRRLAGPS